MSKAMHLAKQLCVCFGSRATQRHMGLHARNRAHYIANSTEIQYKFFRSNSMSKTIKANDDLMTLQLHLASF